MEAGYAKAEVRNQAAREALVPLAPGERPAVVTVSAILAGLVAASILITWAAGVKVNGSHPSLSAALGPALTTDGLRFLVLATEPDIEVVKPPIAFDPVLAKHRFMTGIAAPRYIPTLFGGGRLEGG